MRKSMLAAALLVLLCALRVPVFAEDGEDTPDVTEVFISVTDTVVAHTAMDNPVRFSLIPAEAEKSAKISVSYRAIKSLSDRGTEVEVPKDIGKYIVYIKAEFDDPSYYCAGKYLIYEIAEKQGPSLSEADALRSVPKEFSAKVESKSASFSVAYEPPECTLNVAGVDFRLMYSHIYANGTTGEYTEELPTEPGDYSAACFVLDTVVGKGRIIIDRLTPDIKMDDRVVPYKPEGYYPEEAEVSPAGIELEYKAYTYEDGDVGANVPFPLVNCGTYLISACPKDTAHYGFTPAYCRVTINKVTPFIDAESAVFVEDGKPKPLQFSVSPEYVEYRVNYYKLEHGTPIAVSDVPCDAGEYYAVVSTKGGEALNSVTRVFGIRIEEDKADVWDCFSLVLLAAGILTPAAAVALGCAQIYTALRRKRGEKT